MARIISRLATRVTLAAATIAVAALPAAAAPERIVSLNLCTDELLLRLAAPAQSASVTWLSRDPDSSNVAELAARVPVNHGLAEEVVPLRPDLVLGGALTASTAMALIRRNNIAVHLLGIAKSVEESRRQVREIARVIGAGPRGDELLAAMDRRLAAVPRPPEKRVRALVLNPAGFTIGAGSLVDDIMTRAGLENLAAKPGAPAHMPLEYVAMSAPELLILNAERDGPPSLATELLKHPALAGMPATRTIVLPARLWTCGGPAVIEAIERLSAAARVMRR